MYRIDDVLRFDEASERFLSLIRLTKGPHLSQSTNTDPEVVRGSFSHRFQNTTAILLNHYMEYLNDANHFVHWFTTSCDKWQGRYDFKSMQSCVNHSNSRSSPVDGFTVESPSGSENTCSDSGVFLHLNNNTSHHQQQLLPTTAGAHNHQSNHHSPVIANSMNEGNNSSSISQPRANGSSSGSSMTVPSNHILVTSQVPQDASSLPPESDTPVCHELHDHQQHHHHQQHHESDVMSFELDEVSRMIGPFLSTLLSKLRSMLQNDVYTNLRVTGMISRLASYPIPILRSFLLSPILMMDSKVSSLFDILSMIASEAEVRCKAIPDFEQRLIKAHSLFIAREEALFHSDSNFIRYFSDHYSDSIHDRRISTESLHSENRKCLPVCRVKHSDTMNVSIEQRTNPDGRA